MWTPAPHELHHVLRESEVWDKQVKLGTILMDAGHDPEGIDLSPLAVEFLLRDLRDKAKDINVVISERNYITTLDGDVEVTFRCPNHTHVVGLKLAIG